MATLLIDIAGHTLTPEDKVLLANPVISGIVLFDRNFESKKQLAALTASIVAIDPTLLIAVDQEGGRVQRFKDGFTRLPAMRYWGERYTENPDPAINDFNAMTRIQCEELLACGVNCLLGPVLDLDDGQSAVIGERSLGSTAQQVIALAMHQCTVMREMGLYTVAKHFPGHGSVVADSHLVLPEDTRSLNDIIQRDMQPFVSLMPYYDALMPAHILFSAVDPMPTTFSMAWLQTHLRHAFNYRGPIFSDDLSMQGAVCCYPDPVERVNAAIAAGCDFILLCNNREDVLRVTEEVTWTH